MIESDKDLEYIKRWQTENKGAFQPFRDARLDIKKKLDEFIRADNQAELDKQLYVQQKINEEQTRLKLRQQKEIENAVMEQQQREEEWYLRKLDFEKQIGQSHAEHAKGADFGKTRQILATVSKIAKIHPSKETTKIGCCFGTNSQ